MAIKRLLNDRRGSILVETALVFPMIIALMMGLIFFMGAYREITVMGIAAKEGARTLAVTQGSVSLTRQKIEDELNVGLMRTQQVQVNIDTNENKVTLTRPVGFYMPILGRHLIQLKASHDFFEELEPRYYGKPWNP